jgi:uncharacterized protein involved in exopolysaccharide biosynthesis
LHATARLSDARQALAVTCAGAALAGIASISDDMHATAEADSNIVVAGFRLIRRYRTWILLTSVVVIAGAVAASLLMTRIYRAEVLVSYSSAQATDQPLALLASKLGGLAPFAGLGMGGESDDRAEAIATLKSRTLSLSFIDRYKLMPALFADLWDAKAGRWKVTGDDVPTQAEAFERFDEDVREVSEDTTTGLIRIAINGQDRQQVATWANALVHDANEYLSDRALTEARNSITALEAALDKTNTLEIKQIIYNLIETHLSNATLAKTRADYAFRVIDAAVVPDADDYVRPKPLLFIALSFVLGPALGFLLALLRESWSDSR